MTTKLVIGPNGGIIEAPKLSYRYMQRGERVRILADAEFNMSHGHYGLAGVDHKGRPFDVHISVPPYVHMYDSHKPTFEVGLHIIDGGGNYETLGPRVTLSKADWSATTSEAWHKLVCEQIVQYGVQDCSTDGCSGRAWVLPPTDFARSAVYGPYKCICESCRLAAIDAEYKKEIEKIEAKDAVVDARLKTQGYTHKTHAWVHPPQGDDYELVMHTKGEPSKVQIEAMLRKRRSRVLTDYKVIAL